MQNSMENNRRAIATEGAIHRRRSPRVFSRTTVVRFEKPRKLIRTDHSTSQESTKRQIYKLLTALKNKNKNKNKVGLADSPSPLKTESRFSIETLFSVTTPVNSAATLRGPALVDKWTMTDFPPKKRKINLEISSPKQEPPRRSLQQKEGTTVKASEEKAEDYTLLNALENLVVSMCIIMFLSFIVWILSICLNSFYKKGDQFVHFAITRYVLAQLGIAFDQLAQLFDIWLEKIGRLLEFSTTDSFQREETGIFGSLVHYVTYFLFGLN